MDKISRILKSGGVGIFATDTIYGLVGSALNRKTVERIYRLRKRNLKKPMIILIGSFDDLNLFNIKIDKRLRRILSKFWPGKLSVILPCAYKSFEYLHRGTNKLAFRLPRKKQLIDLLKKTGPLVAPSANPEGSTPAKTIREARDYFGGKVDFYSGKGKLESLPSTLISIQNHKIEIIRQGAIKIAKGFLKC